MGIQISIELRGWLRANSIMIFPVGQKVDINGRCRSAELLYRKQNTINVVGHELLSRTLPIFSWIRSRQKSGIQISGRSRICGARSGHTSEMRVRIS